MRLLLDENLPKRLKLDFPEHDIYTVSDKGCLTCSYLPSVYAAITFVRINRRSSFY